MDVRARVVVNAAGPWSDELRRLDGGPSSDGAGVRGSKGVHIAVPRTRVDNQGALTLLSPNDQRVMFILPSGGQTIIGTTDTFTSAKPDEVRASEADVRYLLDAANTFFPAARLRRDDVVSAWAGIRPLMAGGAEGADPGDASREHAVDTSVHGVVSITGGKLTTYRVMASDVVEAAIARLGRNAPKRSSTRNTPLPGGDLAFIEDAVNAAARATGDPELARHLVRAYGSRWSTVADEIVAPEGGERIVDDLPYTIGELRYAVRYEMAFTLADLLVRRTHLAFQTRDHGLASVERVAHAVAPLLRWSETAIGDAIDAYAWDIRRIFSIDP
jgi:glycerol-3-phosphate dehydrogenase